MQIFFVLLVLVVLSTHTVSAQTSEEFKALREEIEALKEGQSLIQKELQGIKEMLRGTGAVRRDAPPPNLVLDIADDPFKGDHNAKLTLVEFSDYQCPFCARFFSHTLPQLERDYINTGKVKYVFRDFPIESIHKQALKAAEAANCADEQGKYWQMHDRIFDDQKAMGLENLSAHARALGLDMAKFQACLDSGKYEVEIRNDLAEGQKAGVGGTPTFFIGVTEPGKPTVKPLRMIRGAQPYERFKEAIEDLLSTQEKKESLSPKKGS